MIHLIRGNFIEAIAPGELRITPRGWMALDDGRILGVYGDLPEKYAGAPCEDWGDRLILQGFCDMHLHAPQYPMLGLGMDLPLLDWLDTYAFPTEREFADAAYAHTVFRALAEKLIRHGTTRVSAFSSCHTDATLILMEELEKAGVSGYAGKVNMDLCGGEGLQEGTAGSKAETLRWLDACDRFTNVRPILTPRFTPACTAELMAWLGALARERHLRVQSHLSENLEEIALVKRLHPDCPAYWQTYDKFGLLNGHTIMAHCVYSNADERRALRDRGVLVAHCPDSNANLCSGHAPVRDMLDEGLQVGLGSDIAGGALPSMFKGMVACLHTSKAKRVETGWQRPFLTVAEAYYLATTAGAKYFGAGDGFAAGDRLHAVVVGEEGFPPAKDLALWQRFERAVYLAEEGNIAAVYADGRRVR